MGTATFPADCDTRDFDRKIQDKMKSSIKLNMWAIVYSQATERDSNMLSSTLK
jgi:hypothetical protein